MMQLFLGYVTSKTEAVLPGSPTAVPAMAPAVPNLPLPANLPPFNRPLQKPISPVAAPIALSPAHPPFYDPLITSGHPPTSSRLSKHLIKRKGLGSFKDIAPTQSHAGELPSGLAQPPLSPTVSNCCKPDMVLKRGSQVCHCVYPIKIDLLLLNVSQNPNWTVFLNELAYQLGLRVPQIELINFYVISLSKLNISMDITPHTGISFSASEASAINSSLANHMVHLDPTLVGDYELRNLTWFKPLPPSPAPHVATSPVEAPPFRPPTSTPLSVSKKGRHSNLVLFLGIGAGILFIAFASLLVLCLCTSREEKTTASPKEAVVIPHRTYYVMSLFLMAAWRPGSMAPEGRTNYLSTRVMGTFGYVAPEYAMTGHLLVKSDVYSYGVVLLELLTGRKPVDMSQPAGQENLVTWARPILRDKDRLEELADPRLGGKHPKEDFIRVCTIAAACVAPEASQRPTMGEVVQSLKMVQRVMEYQDSITSNVRPNLRQSSTTFESDGTSSMFSSGPYSGLSAFDNDNVSRTAVFSEDLHEGR
ncbi:hypothetical protein FEM48_Zijuj09G0011600 [Ziziphus jujuba var. spinosa]|uniref:Protein kinase domain-containing protein n=1 Tax=Ziziphus jujuba var. spinosa TaxID=714518 RepID=A0A978UQ11_ZIZJJ|nr:hypothetical protein FEM48_Zijuj09G0011600 [Ziziphus jujuba var. spinosa]